MYQKVVCEHELYYPVTDEIFKNLLKDFKALIQEDLKIFNKAQLGHNQKSVVFETWKFLFQSQ